MTSTLWLSTVPPHIRRLTQYAGAMVACGLFHLLLGASPLVVAMAVAIVLVSIAPALRYGLYDIPSFLTFMFGLLYSASALTWKLLTLEALDTGLYDPTLAFSLALAGIATISVAAFLSHLIWPRPPLFKEQYSKAGLEFLVWAGTAWAIGGALLAFELAETASGGISSLLGLGTTILPMTLMAYNVAQGRPALSRNLVLITGMLCILGLATNSRQGILQPVASVAFFLLAFQIKVPRKTLILGLIGGAFFLGIVSPAILAVRSARQFVSPSQIIRLTTHFMTSSQGISQLAAVEHFIDYNAGPYQLNYTHGAGEVVRRFVLIQQLDIYAERAHRFGSFGTARYWRTIYELLPSFIVPNKSASKTPSYGFWVYGLLTWGDEHDETNTPFADAYGYGGFWFMLGSVAGEYLLLFLFFRILAPTMKSSLLGTFLIATSIFAFLSGYLISIPTVFVRQFPFQVAMLWAVGRVRRPIFRLTAPAS